MIRTSLPLACPECGADASAVVDARRGKQLGRGQSDAYPQVGHFRRRRECQECGARWTTVEVNMEWMFLVLKKLERLVRQGGK